MANELSIRIEGDFLDANGVVVSDRNPATVITISGKPYHTFQTIGESEEAITFGDLATARLVWFRNWHATKYVKVRLITGNDSSSFAYVKPGGEPCGPFAPINLTMYGLAETGAGSDGCKLEKFAFEA